MEPILTNVDVESLLAQLSEAVAAEPLDRSKVLGLIARGADPNARDECGDSSFARALSDDEVTVDAVELLIEAGAHNSSSVTGSIGGGWPSNGLRNSGSCSRTNALRVLIDLTKARRFGGPD